MKICRVCATECEDNAELCPLCGAELSETVGREESEEAVVSIENPVLVASVEDVVTAEIYCDMLRDEGVLFTYGTEDDNSMRILFGGGLMAQEIYVDESDLEKAQKIYEALLESNIEFDGDFEGSFEMDEE